MQGPWGTLTCALGRCIVHPLICHSAASMCHTCVQGKLESLARLAAHVLPRPDLQVHTGLGCLGQHSHIALLFCVALSASLHC